MNKAFIFSVVAALAVTGSSKAMADGTTVIYTPNNLPYQAAYGATQALVNTLAPNQPPPAYMPNYGGPAGDLARGAMSGYVQSVPPATPVQPKRHTPPKTKLSKPSIVLPTPQASSGLKAGQTVTGTGEATSGGTLSINGYNLVLNGVTPMSAHHICIDQNHMSYHCGYNATRALQNILDQGQVRCTITGMGNPSPANCTILGQSVNEAVQRRQ